MSNLIVTFKGKPITQSAVFLLNTLFARADVDLDINRFGQAAFEFGIEWSYPAPAVITKGKP